MADWAFSDSSRFTVGGTVAVVGGGTVTASAVANTKGVWQHIAKAPFDVDVLTVRAFPVETAPFDAVKNVLLDVGRGTAGAEEAFISNISIDAKNEALGYEYPFPISVPAGENLSFRSQSNVANRVISAGFEFESHGFAHFAPGSRAKTYGANTATSRSTAVPSTVLNTKGNWVQITPSTSEDIAIIFIIANEESDFGLDTGWYTADLGIGSPGNEKIIIPDITFVTYSANSGLTPYIVGPLSYSIPAGSRLAMRVQSTQPGRDIGFSIVGISR